VAGVPLFMLLLHAWGFSLSLPQTFRFAALPATIIANYE
jgi:hypothetical protein